MKHKSLIILGLLPLACVQADTDIPNVFVGAGIGYQLADDNNYDFSDPNAFNYGLNAGLLLNDNWRWDLGYYKSGDFKTKSGNIEVKPQWFESGLRYDQFLTDNISVYSRLGVSYWKVNKSVHSKGELKANGASPMAEIGISYSINHSLSLDLGYKYIDRIGTKATGQYDANNLGISVVYKFSGQEENKPITTTTADTQEPILEIEPTIESINMEVHEYTLPFKFASSIVDETDNDLLDALSFLKQYPESHIILTGHTDSIGSFESNYILSKERASNVALFLIENGIEPRRIYATGAGEREPLLNNDNPDNRLKNIRVDMVIPSFTYQVSTLIF